MAKLVRANSKTVICESDPLFSSGLDIFSIGFTGSQGQVTHFVQLTPEEARQLAAYVLANDKVLPEIDGPSSTIDAR